MFFLSLFFIRLLSYECAFVQRLWFCFFFFFTYIVVRHRCRVTHLDCTLKNAHCSLFRQHICSIVDVAIADARSISFPVCDFIICRTHWRNNKISKYSVFCLLLLFSKTYTLLVSNKRKQIRHLTGNNIREEKNKANADWNKQKWGITCDFSVRAHVKRSIFYHIIFSLLRKKIFRRLLSFEKDLFVYSINIQEQKNNSSTNVNTNGIPKWNPTR